MAGADERRFQIRGGNSRTWLYQQGGEGHAYFATGQSQRLRKIEGQLGTELFDRGSYPLRPTASGRVFVEYARRAIAAEDRMRREVAGVSLHRRGSLRIGVPNARANALLSGAVVDFYESHRGCTLEFCEMSTIEHMHDLFVGDKIDFAMLTPIAPDPDLYDMEVLCRERLIVAISERLRAPQLRDVGEEGVSVRRLEGIPLVLPKCGSYYDPLISRIIDVTDSRLDVVVRDCSAEFALSLVEEGLGLCLVPSTFVVGRKGLRTYELSDMNAGNVLRYIRRRDSDASEEERLFVEIARKAVSSWASASR